MTRIKQVAKKASIAADLTLPAKKRSTYREAVTERAAGRRTKKVKRCIPVRIDTGAPRKWRKKCPHCVLHADHRGVCIDTLMEDHEYKVEVSGTLQDDLPPSLCP